MQIHPVSYTHLRAHETVLDLVCRLLLEKQKETNQNTTIPTQIIYITIYVRSINHTNYMHYIDNAQVE